MFCVRVLCGVARGSCSPGAVPGGRRGPPVGTALFRKTHSVIFTITYKYNAFKASHFQASRLVIYVLVYIFLSPLMICKENMIVVFRCFVFLLFCA